MKPKPESAQQEKDSMDHPCSFAFLAFLTLKQVTEMPTKTEYRRCEMMERPGAKLYWVIANAHGSVCVEIQDSVTLFQMMHESNTHRAQSDFLEKTI